jgi:hypothetical protein
MSMNWLEATNGHADEPGRPQAMPVFAGQKLVVAGGSSGMGRQTRPCTASMGFTRSAASEPPATWLTPSASCCPRLPAGSPAPSGTSTAA